MGLPIRAHVAFIVACTVSTVAFGSSASVSESDAIRLYLEESPRVQALPLRVQAVDAALRIDAVLPNPTVTYAIEDAAEVRDEFLFFEQQLPVTGRRSLQRKRAAGAASAAGLVAQHELNGAAHSLRLAFYEVLYREAAIEALRVGVTSLEQTVAILRERERQGEGSGYDVLRAEQELAETQIEMARARAELAGARSRLGSFFADSAGMASIRIAGELSPEDSPANAEDAVAFALSHRADLQATHAELESQEMHRRAAKRQRFPEPILAAGWKRTEALDLSDTGFFASLTVPLPIFDRGQPSAVQAKAERGRLELEREILRREIRAEVLTALSKMEAARTASERYGPDYASRGEELRRIARLAYDDGEHGILELLDAYRTSLTMQLRTLDTRYHAKRSEIELDLAMGQEVRP
jgi:cobalt-zinc-cadmium efflux system outer membrane protein